MLSKAASFILKHVFTTVFTEFAVVFFNFYCLAASAALAIDFVEDGMLRGATGSDPSYSFWKTFYPK